MQTLSIVALGVAMVALPARGVLRLRRRGRADLAPWSRLALACLAAAITLGALLALDRWADTMLAAHMLQHMLIGDLVPLLLVLAVRGPLLVQLVPAAALRIARMLRLHRALPRVTRATTAFVAWAAVLGAWHVPAAYDRALASAPLHAFEHLTFMVVGLLVWTVLLDPARRGTLPGWRRFAYALALLAASGVLANTLVLSYRPLYPSYTDTAGRPLGLSPVGDQDLAALVMMLEQLATLGTFAFLSARQQLAAADLEQPQRHPLAA
jgi:cytochrome c oxidase assembly factor CtaG